LRDNHINVPGAEELIRSEIERNGPLPFERFMELALYAPALGYYTQPRDPFGIHGDFFTAEQLQPVFGRLIRRFAELTRERMNAPADFEIVELGAGRGEMSHALSGFNYTPIDIGRGDLPQRINGLVFANEFFDALPVQVAVRRGGVFREVLVASANGAFRFIDGPPAAGETLDYLQRFYPHPDEDSIIEIHLRALEWIDRIARALRGYLLIIDYGYTSREWIRHTAGTLMSYTRHTASDDVLATPGNRDITAHVPFSVLEERVKRRGLTVERFQTLARFLLDTGESDQFASALAAADERDALRLRMQLKTLLYGMGETFRVLLAKSATQ
jgi:SAM-dependent MidA family methyltransferase